MIGPRLFWPQKLAPQRLLGALLASVVLHAVLLRQLAPEALHPPEPEPAPPVLMAHLWMPTPSLKPPPPLVPLAPAERTTTGQQNTRRTARQPPGSVTDTPSATAAAKPTDTHNPETLEPPPPAAPSSPRTDRPLDLSPQVISQAVRRSAMPSLAQAAREQLGHEPAPAASRLGQHIASGAMPDCLHNAPEGEAKSKPVAIGGLFALPFVAYAAMTGKCK